GWAAESAVLVAGRPGEPAGVVRAGTGHALLATAADVAHVRARGLVTGDWAKAIRAGRRAGPRHG
ncbi:MAG TPA: hypothetical protein VLM05_12635, partial [Mycobacteriales bacterium]|nr:hypothetical protein [Mycobacteriales bacterium]